LPDIDECKLPGYPCYGICKNRLNGYDCSCKPGMKGDAKEEKCTERFPPVAKAVVGKHYFAWIIINGFNLFSTSNRLPSRCMFFIMI
jgi:hypothetical protein